MQDVKFLVQRSRSRPPHPWIIPDYSGLEEEELEELLEQFEEEQEEYLETLNELEEFEESDLPPGLKDKVRDHIRKHKSYMEAEFGIDSAWRNERGVRIALEAFEKKIVKEKLVIR